MPRRMIVLLSVAVLAGCSSWFTARVDKQDERVRAAEAAVAAAETEDQAVEAKRRLEVEERQRELATQGALAEQANKQALLMALISLGVGGLKLAAGAAAKGVGA